MSDAFFDADRASGTYPPKGWGWQPTDYQRRCIVRLLAVHGTPDAWVAQEAARLGIPAAPGTCRPLVGLTDRELLAISTGAKTQVRIALTPQPPPEFCRGDVAGITNGKLWSISVMPERKAWHPDPHPGIPCPYGVRGDRLTVTGAALTLALADVQLERVQSISDDEVRAEGWQRVQGDDARARFASEWNGLPRNQNREFAWYANPWVWVLSFVVIDGPSKQ